MKSHRLAVLNVMAGRDFAAALDQHVRWGLAVLDLKDQIFGHRIEELPLDDAGRADGLIRERGLRVETFSTVLFHRDVAGGAAVFADDRAKLEHALRVADVLRPRAIRLLMPVYRGAVGRSGEAGGTLAQVRSEHGYVIDLLGAAVERIAAAGFRTVIETEPQDPIAATTGELLELFGVLGRREVLGLTWDVQNLWCAGVPPTVRSYRELRPIIDMLHLKGGIADPATGRLRYASYLDNASWPVREVVGAAIADGVSPVICINPSHGADGGFYQRDFGREIAFLRGCFAEIE